MSQGCGWGSVTEYLFGIHKTTKKKDKCHIRKKPYMGLCFAETITPTWAAVTIVNSLSASADNSKRSRASDRKTKFSIDYTMWLFFPWGKERLFQSALYTDLRTSQQVKKKSYLKETETLQLSRTNRLTVQDPYPDGQKFLPFCFCLPLASSFTIFTFLFSISTLHKYLYCNLMMSCYYTCHCLKLF